MSHELPQKSPVPSATCPVRSDASVLVGRATTERFVGWTSLAEIEVTARGPRSQVLRSRGRQAT